ncbi:serine hydrolase domain-containing protein [Streptomyces sp. NPDC006372]|uniref:serine hydrolase domain-containing protein n=1 Tax=Streptomyces sp. NPDC006372 TaxID=3155599 RepID=UPI0033BED922
MQAVKSAHQRALASVESGAHLGIQLHVSWQGEVLLDEAYGESAPGAPLTADDAVPWVCCTKLLGALAMGQLMETTGTSPDTPVSALVPAFTGFGKQTATIAHLMSHAIPFDTATTTMPFGRLTHEEALEAVATFQLSGAPGTGGWYSPMETWVVVAAMVRQLSGLPFDEYVQRHILDPLGMEQTVFGAVRAEALADHRITLHDRAEGNFVPSTKLPDAILEPGLPGTGAHGPARELARLASPESWRDQLGLSDPTARTLTQHHRTGLVDTNFGDLDLDWGLGMCTDRAWFGAPRGARVAGHTAYGMGMVMADLEEQLTVSFLSTSIVPQDGAGRLENHIVRDLCTAVRQERDRA